MFSGESDVEARVANWSCTSRYRDAMSTGVGVACGLLCGSERSVKGWSLAGRAALVGAWVVEIWSRKALKVDMSTRRVERLEGLSLMLCSTEGGELVSCQHTRVIWREQALPSYWEVIVSD